MFTVYRPTKTEREVIKYRVFVYPNRVSLDTQDKIIGAVAQAIHKFDYTYELISHPEYIEGIEKEKVWINEHLEKIEDVKTKNYLVSCFNKFDYKNVYDIFEWRGLLSKKTFFTDMVIDYRSKEIYESEVCFIVGVKKWISNITKSLGESNILHRVVYSNEVPAAAAALNEGVYWYGSEDKLKAVAVNNNLAKELHDLVVLIASKVLTIELLQSLFPQNADIMYGEEFNVVLINCFYLIIRNK